MILAFKTVNSAPDHLTKVNASNHHWIGHTSKRCLSRSPWVEGYEFLMKHRPIHAA